MGNVVHIRRHTLPPALSEAAAAAADALARGFRLSDDLKRRMHELQIRMNGESWLAGRLTATEDICQMFKLGLAAGDPPAHYHRTWRKAYIRGLKLRRQLRAQRIVNFLPARRGFPWKR